MMVLALSLVTAGLAFTKDSRNVKLEYAASIHGTQLARGEYQVNWETHSPEATVTFKQKKTVVATAAGKLEQRPNKFENNSVLYSTNSDGSRSIVEIRLGGTNQVLIFGESSPTSQVIMPGEKLNASAAAASPALREGQSQRVEFLGKPTIKRQALVESPYDFQMAGQPAFKQPVRVD